MTLHDNFMVTCMRPQYTDFTSNSDTYLIICNSCTMLIDTISTNPLTPVNLTTMTTKSYLCSNCGRSEYYFYKICPTYFAENFTHYQHPHSHPRDYRSHPSIKHVNSKKSCKIDVYDVITM